MGELNSHKAQGAGLSSCPGATSTTRAMTAKQNFNEGGGLLGVCTDLKPFLTGMTHRIRDILWLNAGYGVVK